MARAEQVWRDLDAAAAADATRPARTEDPARRASGGSCSTPKQSSVRSPHCSRGGENRAVITRATDRAFARLLGSLLFDAGVGSAMSADAQAGHPRLVIAAL